ncbi:MAG: hypothetical protein HOD34_02520 [Candidatus Peribacter sp.]|nr:hypothetical protein [Candidatus Peribacter sp.]
MNMFSEKRLCRFAGKMGSGPESLKDVYEVVRNHEKLENNTDLQAALDFYDKPLMRTQFPEFTSQSPERPYMIALLLNGMVDTKVPPGESPDYSKIELKDIDPADPFQFMEKYGSDPTKMGAFLQSFLPVEIQESILPNDGTDPNYVQKLGSRYSSIVGDARINFRSGKEVDNSLFAVVNMAWMRHIQQKIQKDMKRFGIRVKGKEMEFASDRARKTTLDDVLTRREYLTLLSQGTQDVTAAKFSSDTDLLRKARDKRSLSKRTGGIFTDISVSKYGPTETLSQFGVEIGEKTRQKYIDSRTGVRRDSVGKVMPSDEPVTFVPSAAQWPRRPADAYVFLNEHMPTVRESSNFIFLRSLEWHYVLTAEEKKTKGKPKPLMSIENTDAALALVSKSLTDYEAIMTESNRQIVDFKEDMTVTQKAEEFMSGSWEYMKDFSSHPLGSSLMWVTAIVAARGLMNGVFKGKMKMWKFLLVGGAAVGMYQQHSKGRAYWDSALDAYDKMLGRESLLDPKERTLANYWLRELREVKGAPGQFDELTPQKEQLSLALMGQVPVDQTLDFYNKWRVYRNNPDGNPPELPIDYYEFLNHFGHDATEEEIGDALYLTMEKFFTERGQMAKRELLHLDIPGGMYGDAGLGYAYIREKYMENRLHERLLENMGVKREVLMDPSFVGIMKGDIVMTDKEMKNKFPEIFKLVKKLRVGTDAERKKNMDALLFFIRFLETRESTIPTAGYPFNHVFFMEGNPETMALMDAEGANKASLWQRIFSWGSDVPPDIPAGSPGGSGATGGTGGGKTASPKAAPAPSTKGGKTASPKAAPAPSTKGGKTASPKAAPAPSTKGGKTASPKAAPAPSTKGGKTASPKAAPAPGTKGGKTASPKAAPAPSVAPKSTASPRSIPSSGAKSATSSPSSAATTGAKRTTSSPSSAATTGAKRTTSSPSSAATSGAKRTTSSPSSAATTGAKKVTSAPSSSATSGAKKVTSAPSSSATSGAKKVTTAPSSSATSGAKKVTTAPSSAATNAPKRNTGSTASSATNAPKTNTGSPSSSATSGTGRQRPNPFGTAKIEDDE